MPQKRDREEVKEDVGPKSFGGTPMNGSLKRVLVTVKTYPNPSRKYSETVCVAGIDLDRGEWIRLFPIPFRDLDDEKKFKKYSVIEVRATKAKDDARPESYKVDANSIEIVDHIDTRDKWKKRSEIVLPTGFFPWSSADLKSVIKMA